MNNVEIVTVSKLKKQLEWLEKNGMGDYAVLYNNDSINELIECGLWYVDKECKNIALG